MQYVRFRVPEEARKAWETGTTARFVAAHPRFSATATVSDETRAELLSDLVA